MKKLFSICLLACMMCGATAQTTKGYLPYQDTNLSPEQRAEDLLKRLRKADVVVFAGGISPQLEGEEMSVDAPGFRKGDRDEIELPTAQREVLNALKKAGKKIVFVNFSGSAIALTQEVESCDAILQAWYPGQEGGTAIANILFGDYNPAGRLPITFYKNKEQLPDFEDYSMKGRTYRFFKQEPLFPFGFGLSYTQFAYQPATLDKSSLEYGETATLTIPVQNIGQRDGEEVVQIYLSRPDDTEGPIKTLRGVPPHPVGQRRQQRGILRTPLFGFRVVRHPNQFHAPDRGTL